MCQACPCACDAYSKICRNPALIRHAPLMSMSRHMFDAHNIHKICTQTEHKLVYLSVSCAPVQSSTGTPAPTWQSRGGIRGEEWGPRGDSPSLTELKVLPSVRPLNLGQAGHRTSYQLAAGGRRALCMRGVTVTHNEAQNIGQYIIVTVSWLIL